MRNGVYVLTPLGRQALAGEVPGVPPELRALLGAIDGRRSRGELLEIFGRSTVTAGGISWLAAAGYIARQAPVGVAAPSAPDRPQPTQAPQAPATRPAEPAPSVRAPVSIPATVQAPSRAPDSLFQKPSVPPRAESRPVAPAHEAPPSSLGPLHDALAAYLIETVRRYMPEEAERHRRRILQAQSINELLAHLNPVIDAVIDFAGPHAAAEFADKAAAILQPGEQ